MRKIVLLLALILLTLPNTAMGDIVILKDGSRMEGVVSRHGSSLHVDLGYGQVVLPMRLVERVISQDTPRQKYEKKLAGIDQADAEQLKALQQWCSRNGLKKEARELALKVGELVLERQLSELGTKDAGAVFDFALWCRHPSCAVS